MKRFRILLDVDGVLADFTGACAKWAQSRFPERASEFTHERVTQWDTWAAWGIKEHKSAFYEYAAQPGFCASIDDLPGAHEFVESLRELGEVIAVTSPLDTPTWCQERKDWLVRQFKFSAKDVVFCQRKELIKGDILIDDGAHNVEAFARYGGGVALLDQPWNRDYFTPARCMNFTEVLNRVSMLKAQ